MHHLTHLLFTAALLIAGTSVQAAGQGCPDARSHQFDFWIGSWDVINVDGTLAGHNRIQPILDGCVLQETWAGFSDSAGTSLNFFDTTRNKWREFWVWREGTTLELEGGLINGAMVLEGDRVENGKVVLNRITWTHRPDGTVNQLWENSTDNSKSWKTVFDGTYRPAKTQ